MPTLSNGFDKTWAQRRQAWAEHYMAKGCSVFKANALAREKRFKSSWPPGYV